MSDPPRMWAVAQTQPRSTRLRERIEKDFTESGQRSAIDALCKIGDERALPAFRWAVRKGVTAANRKLAEEVLVVVIPVALNDARARLGLDPKLTPMEVVLNLRKDPKGTAEERLSAFVYATHVLNSSRLSEVDLASMLDDPYPEFRDSAAKSLTATNAPLACREFLTRLNTKAADAPKFLQDWYASSLVVKGIDPTKWDAKLLKEIRDSATHPLEAIRKAAIGFFGNGELARSVPLETWKLWFADKSSALQELAVKQFLELHGQAKKLNPGELEAIRDLGIHPAVSIRKAAMGFFGKGELDRSVPLETWKLWFADESPAAQELAIKTFLDTYGQAKKLEPAVLEVIRDLGIHPVVWIRKAAVGMFQSPEYARQVPVKTWKLWLADQSDDVRASAVNGLLARGDPDGETVTLLDELKSDPSKKVKAALEEYKYFGEAENRLSAVIRDETVFVAHVRLRTLLDYLPFKKHALTPLKEALKTIKVFQKFQFDPVADVSGIMFSSSTKEFDTSCLALYGQFKKDKMNDVVEGEVGGITGAAVAVSDSLILAAGSKATLEKIRKPRTREDVAKLPLVKLIPKEPDQYLAWAVLKSPINIDLASLKALGIDIQAGEWEKLSGVVLTIGLDKGNWKFTVKLPTSDADAAEGWGAHLNKLIVALTTFLPIIAGNQPQFKESVDALCIALGSTKYDLQGKVASASFLLDEKVLELFLKALFPEVK